MFGNVLGVKTFTTDLAPNVMIGPTKASSVTFNSKIVREYIASNRPRYDFNMKNLIFSLSFEMYPYRDMITSLRFEMYPYKVLRCTPTETWTCCYWKSIFDIQEGMGKVLRCTPTETWTCCYWKSIFDIQEGMGKVLRCTPTKTWTCCYWKSIFYIQEGMGIFK